MGIAYARQELEDYGAVFNLSRESGLLPCRCINVAEMTMEPR